MLWALDWCLGGSSYNGSVGIADSFVFFWDPFPGAGLPCPVLMWGGLSGLIVSYCDFLCTLDVPGKPVLLWIGIGAGAFGEKEVWWGGGRRRET